MQELFDGLGFADRLRRRAAARAVGGADVNPVAVVVLAAGGSSRMGRPKQLLPFCGRSLLRHSTRVALDAACGPVFVVLGARADQFVQEISGLPVTVVVNPDWERGPGTSVRAGVEAVEADPGTWALVVTVCDQPLVSGLDIRRLIEAGQGTGRPMAAAEYSGSIGVPAFFARSCFSDLRGLEPAACAKRLLARRPDEVAVVTLPTAAIDLDTPDDYKRWWPAPVPPATE
ncbi:MAG: 4-diphosphocytidyl-2C-methyl-D-erythritol synthase [Gemmataceae bacterium]|nr:4-diphosphocytidyl-2C-methyl-D-erythritol synthase [Gemmataceae bacterium]